MYACLREFLLEFGQGARGCIVGEQGWPAAAIYIAIPSILVLRITEWFGLEGTSKHTQSQPLTALIVKNFFLFLDQNLLMSAFCTLNVGIFPGLVVILLKFKGWLKKTLFSYVRWWQECDFVFNSE